MKKTRILTVMLIVVLAAGTWAVPPAQAVLYEVEKEIALYGNLSQNQIPDPLGSVACGPVAAINSFTYLQNKYPTVYDNLLVTNPVADATTLAGQQYMNTQPPGGTWVRDFVWGKELYIEDRAPGRTIYHGESTPQGIYNQMLNPGGWDPEGRYKPAWLTEYVTGPTWRFMYEELQKCQDVEILLNWSGGGHYLTLTSFHWNDADNDQVIDFLENAWIDFIDPANGLYGTSNIWQNSYGAAIESNYVVGSNITMAVAESPVPLPAGIWLLASGLLALIGVGRRMN